MKQMNYGFSTPVGHAGGLYDLTGYVCDSFNNGEKDGVLKHGMGVVTGDKAGVAALPKEGSTIKTFEGVLVNGLTTEHTMDGKVSVREGQTVGILKQGRIWARVTEDAVPAYNKPVLLIVKGKNAGLFTTSDDTENTGNTIAVNAKFLTEKGTSLSWDNEEGKEKTVNIAAAEFYPTVIVAANS